MKTIGTAFVRRQAADLMSDRMLHDLADTMMGKPIRHEGRTIGRIVRAWVDGDEVKVEIDLSDITSQ